MTRCPPPANFHPAGDVRWAAWAQQPPFIREKRRTGRRAQGVRYERKVHEYLEAMFPDQYIPSPWLMFEELGVARPRWCQPDGLLIDLARGEVTIVEVKYQHTSDAWWQMFKLYRPVLEVLLPKGLWTYRCVEVVKWYDPATVFPAAVRLSECPKGVGEMSVHIWRP